MGDPLVPPHAPRDRAGRVLLAVTKAFALAGGLVLIALTGMSFLSVVGRAAFAKPLPGDYELIQLGCAVAVAAFLPFCQMRGGHVLVDFSTAHSRPSARATLDTLGAVLLGIAAAVFTWRLTAGAIGLREANDQTTILEIPTWYAVALMVPSFALFSVAGFYTAWVHWRHRARDDGASQRSTPRP
jgi:TRAP-type C4-dicarboxylate transport system permease small subunit